MYYIYFIFIKASFLDKNSLRRFVPRGFLFTFVISKLTHKRKYKYCNMETEKSWENVKFSKVYLADTLEETGNNLVYYYL